MDLASLVQWGLKASVFLTVASIGLGAGWRDAAFLLARPRRLGRAMAALFLVMPLLAVGLAIAFHFHPAVEVAMIALAISPIPPLMPRKVVKAGIGFSFAIGLVVAASLVAVVVIPLVVDLLGLLLGRAAHITMGTVFRVVLLTVILPLGAGMALRALVPGLADRFGPRLGDAAALLMLACLLPTIVAVWPQIAGLVGNGTILALVVFTAAGLATGHLLGGPEAEDRVVLALATGCRHPGVALSIAMAQPWGGPEKLGAVVLYLMVGAVLSLGYLAWCRRRRRLSGPAGAA